MRHTIPKFKPRIQRLVREQSLLVNLCKSRNNRTIGLILLDATKTMLLKNIFIKLFLFASEYLIYIYIYIKL